MALDYVREALDKANASLDRAGRETHGGPPLAAPPSSMARPELTAAPAWMARQVQLDRRLLEKNRIVSFAMSDPSHISFNHLRTRVRKVMQDSGWRMLGVTSPTPSCGKTMVSLNLAFSLARGGDLRIVVVDLDFKRPSVARTLGVKPETTIAAYLRGTIDDPSGCFVQLGGSLFAGLNGDFTADSAELIQSARMGDLMAFISQAIRPDIVLFDLPPMKASDDALALLPRIDAALLVIAAGKTKLAEVDECERQIGEHGKVLGVVLNKAEASNDNAYQYY